MDKEKMKTWNKKSSKIGLGISLAYISVVIMFLLSPIIGAGGGTSTVAGSVTVQNACAFTTDNSAITYGGSTGLTPYPSAANTLANGNFLKVTDTGDATSNILINGASSTWASGGNNFGVTNTVYASASHSYFVYPANTWSTANAANGNVIALTSVQEDTTIPVNTLSPNTIYTGLQVPASQAGGTYTLTIDITSSC